MNILLVSYLFYPEPIVMSTIVEDLACYLSEKHSVTVLTSPPADLMVSSFLNRLKKQIGRSRGLSWIPK